MLTDPYYYIVESIIKAWQSGNTTVRILIIIASILIIIAIIMLIISNLVSIRLDIRSSLIRVAPFILAPSAALLLGTGAYYRSVEKEDRNQRIRAVEERAREHPEKPQLAWDLARTKLESYLDRNLSQVKSIYWLTLIVMMFGFGFIIYGLYKAFADPDNFAIAIVSSASGVIISFIGGSFLLIYRSILSQSKDYVTILERINAVGMAVQVISNIPDERADLKHRTTAELAKQLLGLYANTSGARPPDPPAS